MDNSAPQSNKKICVHLSKMDIELILRCINLKSFYLSGMPDNEYKVIYKQIVVLSTNLNDCLNDLALHN